LDVGNLIAILFASVTIFAVIRFLEGGIRGQSNPAFNPGRPAIRILGRRTLAGMLMGLSLSAFAVASVHRGYYLAGLHYTELEVEAIKRIDEYTQGRYIVISNIIGLGWGFVGLWNPEKFYVYDPSFMGKGIDLSANPSVETMVYYMKMYQADTGYFMVTFRNANFDDIVAKASRIFALFHILENENGKIYIFKYRIPPFPSGPNIMAFYWDTPTSYYVQNDLVRVVFNNASRCLDIMDASDYLYESIGLNETFADGNALGRVLSVEYYIPLNDTWIYWDPQKNIPFGEVPAYIVEVSIVSVAVESSQLFATTATSVPSSQFVG